MLLLLPNYMVSTPGASRWLEGTAEYTITDTSVFNLDKKSRNIFRNHQETPWLVYFGLLWQGLVWKENFPESRRAIVFSHSQNLLR